jgi:hypothetical protein
MIQRLREAGHDAHRHPVTRRVAIRAYDRWWYVMGGNAEYPSLLAAPDEASPEKEDGS